MDISQKKLITFSGIDGAGKSTQAKLLIKNLENRGYCAIYLWSRGGYTSFFEELKILLRKVLPNSVPSSGHSKKRGFLFKKKFIRKLWLSIALADLARVYGITIRFWQMSGKIVICDRYLFDTLLDFKMNFPQEKIESRFLWKFLRWIAVKPDANFLFMIPIEESVQRSEIKGDPYPEPLDVRQKRYSLYNELAQNETFYVIDATMSEVQISDKIEKIINQLV